MEGLKEMIERQMSEFSKLRDEFQEIADSMRTELGSLKVRIRDLEEHTNRKDEELESMDRRLAASERMCNDLKEQVHANEVINRLPTLIFSGPAVVNSASLQSSGPRPGDRSTPAGPARRRGTTRHPPQALTQGHRPVAGRGAP